MVRLMFVTALPGIGTEKNLRAWSYGLGDQSRDY